MNNDYIDKLIQNCEFAKKTKPVKEFSFIESVFSEFTPANISKLNNIKKAIYIIKGLNTDSTDIFDKMAEYKKTKERKCPKLNSPSSTIYVGSSTTGVKKRIEQHLGLGNKNTYSLQLKWWIEGEFEITVQEYDENLSLEILQIIEDNLSYQLKPAFGKTGGNNK